MDKGPKVVEVGNGQLAMLPLLVQTRLDCVNGPKICTSGLDVAQY